ncbi:hypothetical protein [Kitasatospora sp. NBC_01302]|uniref:hypothetical protein n=1 Tax=Kitasatospora sp. NBC_01302 TaxID=2903575 RepID=UPI002E0D7A81|nr:hypothetical protein OG294_06685 [Kitasatospora sp. NBC_01302]
MSRTTIRTVGAAALLAAGLLLTGCSSSSTTASAASAKPSASASADGKGSQAMAAYASCLQQHGVTMPTGRPSGHPSGRPSGAPGGGGGGGGFYGGGASADSTRQAAMQACASLRPQGGQGRGGAGGFNSTAMQAFTGCLKDHGVTLPATGGLRGLNTADPATAAAYKTCAPLLPAKPSGAPADGASASPSAS